MDLPGSAHLPFKPNLTHLSSYLQTGFGQVVHCDGYRVIGHFCHGMLHGPAIHYSDRGLPINSDSFWSETTKGLPSHVKSGLRKAGFYLRGIRHGSAFEMHPAYMTITYGTVDEAGAFTGGEIAQVRRRRALHKMVQHNLTQKCNCKIKRCPRLHDSSNRADGRSLSIF